jgi:hypothetical protein
MVAELLLLVFLLVEGVEGDGGGLPWPSLLDDGGVVTVVRGWW